MQVSSISNTIISTLGSPSSLAPMALKDSINSVGITYYSYEHGGKVEGKDRFIDEFGTQFVWLFGLPIFKTLIDNTIYKIAKFNPDIDIRVATSKNHLKFIEKLTKDKKLLADVKHAENKLPIFKKLFYTKFALATILTFLSYYALTKYKQMITKKNVKKNFYEKLAKKQQEKTISNVKSHQKSKIAPKENNPTDKTFTPSFKAAGAFESFMFNPIKNLFIVDTGITGERLSESRNKHEFWEYAIKECSFLLLMYVVGNKIQNFIEKLSEKYLHKSIDMSLKFINSKELKNAMENKSIENDIKEFKKLSTQVDILNYIADKPESILVKGGKLSDLIGVTSKANSRIKGFMKYFGITTGQESMAEIDPKQYIDTDDFKTFVNQVEKFAKQQKNSGMPLDKFLKITRNLKIFSVVANIGISILALGVIMPKLIFVYRQKFAGDDTFHVQKDYEKELQLSFNKGVDFT